LCHISMPIIKGRFDFNAILWLYSLFSSLFQVVSQIFFKSHSETPRSDWIIHAPGPFSFLLTEMNAFNIILIYPFQPIFWWLRGRPIELMIVDLWFLVEKRLKNKMMLSPGPKKHFLETYPCRCSKAPGINWNKIGAPIWAIRRRRFKISLGQKVSICISSIIRGITANVVPGQENFSSAAGNTSPCSILAFVELRLPPLIIHKETAPPRLSRQKSPSASIFIELLCQYLFSQSRQ